MRPRKSMMLGLAAACAASAWAATFSWTAHGADDDWDTCGNWVVIGGGCSPDDGNDDATVPYTSGGWTINLVQATMDDLTINGSVTFGNAGGTPELTVDSLTIGATNAETVLDLTGGGGASIKTD